MMRHQRRAFGRGDVPFMRFATLVALLGCLSLGLRGQDQIKTRTLGTVRARSRSSD